MRRTANRYAVTFATNARPAYTHLAHQKMMKIFLTAIFIQLASSAWGSAKLPLAESVLIDKSQRKMWLIASGQRYREYNISLGDNPIGHKEYEGDEKTPEGNYFIDYRNPESSYHLSLHIDYPQKKDEYNAKLKDVDPGGNIFIHGLPNDSTLAHDEYEGRDWTDGCIAVDNLEIEEIWVLVKDGTPIEIRQ
jgi:murein L,D-transpeptidase YafK